ncbi:carbohydrate ABC transporter permease [Spirillospora sp. CA-255316]
MGAGWTFLFVGPGLALYLLMVLAPVGATFFNGLFSWSGTTRGDFVGLHNFRDLTHGVNAQAVLPALRHNAVFFALTMVLQNGLGLFLALGINSLKWGRRFFQTLFALPFLISPIIVGYIWLMLLDANFGPIPTLFQRMGLSDLAQPWAAQPNTALVTAVVVSAWQLIGAPILIFGAALGGVPREVVEAAQLDGAGRVRRFFAVELPYLRPAINIVTVLTFISSFSVLDLMFALGGGSGGGPGGALDTIGLLFYRTAFANTNNAQGLSSAMAVMIFLLVFVGAIVIGGLLRRWERD